MNRVTRVKYHESEGVSSLQYEYQNNSTNALPTLHQVPPPS